VKGNKNRFKSVKDILGVELYNSIWKKADDILETVYDKESFDKEYKDVDTLTRAKEKKLIGSIGEGNYKKIRHSAIDIRKRETIFGKLYNDVPKEIYNGKTYIMDIVFKNDSDVKLLVKVFSFEMENKKQIKEWLLNDYSF